MSPKPGTWSGFDYGSPVPVSREMLRLLEKALPDPEPTFEERRQRCTEMGLILCSCTGVDRGGEYVMIYDINCPIHHGERRR